MPSINLYSNTIVCIVFKRECVLGLLVVAPSTLFPTPTFVACILTLSIGTTVAHARVAIAHVVS